MDVRKPLDRDMRVYPDGKEEITASLPFWRSWNAFDHGVSHTQ